MTSLDTTIRETTLVKPKTYAQDWPAYNAAQTAEKDNFQLMLSALCSTIEQPDYSFGRPSYPLSDMIYASALKIYCGFSSRRFDSDSREAARKGYIESAPSYPTLNRTIQNPDLTPLIIALVEESASPLTGIETDFAIDSTGFSTSRFDRWFDEKWGKEKSKRHWKKAHAAAGVKTNIVTAIAITDSKVNDTTMYRELLDITKRRFNVQEISADRAYLSEKNLRYTENMGAKPFIPFKSNTTGKGSAMWRRLHAQFILNEEQFNKHYHKRSNVETVFSMVKSKFGDSVRAKSETGQVNEILLKFLCHNLCVINQEVHELGITSTFGPNINN